MTRGLRARTTPSDSLPKHATICEQSVRCGRTSCRCTRGEPHGPYYYLFWRERGRLRKRYVRRADVAEVRAECAARATTRREFRAALRESRTEIRRLTQEIRNWRRP